MGVQPPAYALICEAAKEWGIPPWQVEAECTAYWWKRWLRYRMGGIKAMK